MSNHERRQQRIILGWALEMPPGHLAGAPLKQGIKNLQTQLFELLQRGEIGKLAPDASRDIELKKRLLRIEQALAGVSFRAIADQEGVMPGAVRDSVKDTLKRLRTIGPRDE